MAEAALEFPPSLAKESRAAVHATAASYALQSTSQGLGPARFVRVFGRSGGATEALSRAQPPSRPTRPPTSARRAVPRGAPRRRATREGLTLRGGDVTGRTIARRATGH